jgi:allantoinase
MKTYDSIIRGRLVTPDGILDQGWLAIADGRIAAIGQGEAPAAKETHDVGNDWVVPGIIDGQTHAGSCQGLKGLESTTRSAIAGGVTTIVDMPYDDPNPLSTMATLEAKVKAIDTHAYCDVALYGTVDKGQPPTEIAQLAKEGICAIKISAYEVHPSRFPRISNAETLDLLEVAAEVGLPVGLHNEDQEIVHARIARMVAQGKTTFDWHSPSRPPAAELASTAAFLELGAATGAHVHIVHISLPRGYQLVDQYRQDGYKATAEACVHYLSFDAAVHGPIKGARLKVNPPIREGVLDGLWAALQRGSVEFVSSDHSSWPLGNKNAKSIFDAGAGIPGLETLVPGFYTALKARSATPLQDLVLYLAEKPAKFFGLWPQKGALMVGADADVTVLKDADWIYDSAKAHDDLNWTPYDGERFECRVAATFLRGAKVWDGANILGKPGDGRYAKHVRSLGIEQKTSAPVTAQNSKVRAHA